MQDIHYDVFISYSNFDKYIADAACHFIEARKLRCFIAPRDITTPDWAGCITNAIAHSKAFVVIVSEHSIDSPEVSKEITLATRVSNYIFPFLIEDTQMNERMAYHLSAYHWIDAITPPIEQRLNELADRVVSALARCDSNEKTISCTTNLNKSARRLIGQNVSPRAEFIGREKELKTIETLFDNGATNVFLTGMGGIGKSEIAKAYAKRRKNQYHTVVFANYESDLMHMIASDQTVFVENLSRSVASGGQAETLEDYYLRKMEVLRTILDRNTLLIIDNFDVDADDEMERIMALPCDIVWTTRTDFSAFGYDTVTIGPMDDMNALICLYERMDRSYPAECEQEVMKAIVERLEHHTFAVSLTAAQGKAAHMKPTKMLEKLSAEGLEIQTSSGFVREISDRRKMTAYMYIEKLFDFSKISEEACQLMRLMAIMPREGVAIDLFMECAAIDDYGVIEELISKNWIRLDEEADRINLHMLVHEVVWKHLVPTVENCSQLLEGAYHKVSNAWNTSYEENCRMESMIYAILHAFPEPTAAYFDHFEAFATYCWIQGNFSLAEQYEMKLYALSCAAWGECSMHTGSAALRVAAVYHNQADYAAARPWYEKGLEIQSKAAPGTPQNAVALSKVARCYAQNQDLQKAEEMFCVPKYSMKINFRQMSSFTMKKKSARQRSELLFAAIIWHRFMLCKEMRMKAIR